MNPKKGIVERTSGFAVRRPWLTIALWAVSVAALGVAGLDTKSVLTNTDMVVSGTPGAKALEAERDRFGHKETLAVLLTGSPRSLRQYGPQAAHALEKIEGVRVIHPWATGAPKGLLRGKTRALLALEVHSSFEVAGTEKASQIRSTLNNTLPASVRAHVTGTPVIGKELNRVGYEAAKRAEIIAAPFLLLILLVVFRSPLAAFLPLVLGMSVIFTGSGLLALVGRLIDIDFLASTLMSMIGLALGVDYSLLAVSRFREELGRHPTSMAALKASMSTAGRTILFAGAVVIVGLSVVLLIAPGSFVVSAMVGAAGAALLSVTASTTLLPACLTLLGSSIDRWHIGRRSAESAVALIVRRIIKRPVAATFIVMIPLLLLTANALTVNTGIFNEKGLPSDNKARRDTEEVGKAYGVGWGIPYVVLAKSKDGPVTTPKSLASLAKFQKGLEKDPAVDAVIGPAAMAAGADELKETVTDGPDQLGRLEKGLGEAGRGTESLRAGLAKASNGSAGLAGGTSEALAGSESLEEGVTSAQAGIGSLASGLDKTEDGSTALTAAVARLKTGAEKLKAATAEARKGAAELDDPAGAFREELEKSNVELEKLGTAPRDAQAALERAKTAMDALPISAKADPNYKSAYQELLTALGNLSGLNPLSGSQVQTSYYGLTSALDRAQNQTAVAAKQAGELAKGTSGLSQGLGKLDKGNAEFVRGQDKALTGTRELSGALRKASSGSKRLSEGARRLSGGSSALTGGITQINFGADELHRGLNEGHTRSSGLSTGIEAMHAEVKKTSSKLAGPSSGKEQETLDQRSTSSSSPDGQGIDTKRFANSGYLTLAALDGASSEEKKNAQLVINANSGGDAARVFVMLKENPINGGQASFYKKLKRQSQHLSTELKAEVMVGGRASALNDYESLSKARQIPMIVALSIVTLLLLIVIFRSILLAVKAVVLNLLTVGAAFGVTVLLFQGSDPLLGGPGWVFAPVFYGVYAIVFTLSMDYEVFIINRMREGYLRTGSNELAIEEGVNKTARVVSGGAAIMVTVFMIFASTGVNHLMQFGITLSVAVITDATVVRLILLPATMRLFGRANWWLPGWLARRLPRLNTD